MSRIANAPVTLPSGVEAKIDGQRLTIKGAKGSLSHEIHRAVSVQQDAQVLRFKATSDGAAASTVALTGTTRALANNMVLGVSQGFEKKLSLVGVGYRAQVKGRVLNLLLGFSHPVDFAIPAGIDIETPSNTEIVVRGVDKQLVGQVSATIRSFRPPEPYKGKGVRYTDEHVVRKEAKKK